jgi:hypothetical protein
MGWSMISVAVLFVAVTSANAQERIQFNRDIRPILAENCFYCHGVDANKRKADLRLHERRSAVESRAIVPGKAAASELIRRVFSEDSDTMMPPPSSNRKLSADQRQLLRRWIDEGAEYQTHWAFVAPVRPELPAVKNNDWVRTPIDRFVLSKLEAEGLKPSPQAERATLIRRLSIDLVGLPPSPAEVDAFVSDADPRAYEKLVDRLLSSPHYGERMALPWLDAARYADSNGFQQDGDTWQWIWRDWVVKALNDDLPFDQFTIWQLAGDLLPNATIEQKVASGFNRNHLLNGEGGAIPEEQRWVNLFDRMETTFTTWLGLTMTCAQCHDHKYDPITMRDYYSLLDAFNRVPESGTPQRFSSRIRVAAPFVELPTAENSKTIKKLEGEIAKLESEVKAFIESAFIGWRDKILKARKAEGIQIPKKLAQILDQDDSARSESDQKELTSGLRKLFDDKVRPGLKSPKSGALDALKKKLADYRGDQIPRAMIMSDTQPRPTHILDRGEYLKPREKVSFDTPQFLPPLRKDAPRNRLGLARWLVSAENPLTSRVQVNRMWQHFFGVGLVKTTEDLGVQGEFPIHGPLLDWLAVEFRESGWSMKSMHRLIVTSAVYRQSSKVTPVLKSRDIENRLIARASRFRMPSMLLRDWALAASGLLDLRIGGSPVYPYQPDDVWESLAITKERDFTYPASKGADLYRRSLYTFWRRTVAPANMFDASNRQTCRVRLATTSTPLHALTTLNDPTWVEAARVLAERTMKANRDLDGRVREAFQRVVGRRPRDNEVTILHSAFQKQLAMFTNDRERASSFVGVGASPRDTTLDVAEHAALSVVCLMILNLDESLTRE